jgi:hypothetical protein
MSAYDPSSKEPRNKCNMRIFIRRLEASQDYGTGWYSTPWYIYPMTHVCPYMKLSDVMYRINENSIDELEPCPYCNDRAPALLLLAEKLGVA